LVGALSEEKRVPLALEALAAVPDTTIVIAGNGPDMPNVERTVAQHPELEGRVTMLGVIYDVETLLHASDLLLQVSRTEGMPGTLIEAGLCRVPVVATDVGAVRWMLEQQVFSGRLISANPTVTEVASIVRDVCANPAPFASTGSVCEWGAVGPQWLGVLRQHRLRSGSGLATP
jgi:glycosyltransferase involved in cell wall biosynthesis